ncbi:MAG: glucose-1-phosphate adenylyltransferase subunit GlgD [Granulicatella sp.]|nr:MAG: glucose-1-phosphate adenylyltransferase subunit GlgD [Granulicatella sp.]
MRLLQKIQKLEVTNMIKAFCVLFADNYRNDDLQGLVRNRTAAALPVISRYRMVDFMISSLVHANIDNIAVLTNHNYKSLLDHMSHGKDWDLNRKNRGLKFITPMSNYLSTRIPQNKIEALANTMVYTQSLDEEFVILADTNIIGNIDFKEMFQYHLDTGSDITVAYTYRKPNVGESQIIFDENHKVYESLYHFDGSENICATQVKIYILTKELFNGIVKKGLTLGWEDILRDYIAKNLETLRVFAYQIKGYLKVVNNIKDYYDLNMDMLDFDNLKDVFLSGTDIITRVQDTVPTIYGKNADVKGSILGDGSKINGTVENSIIFRDVVVEEGAVVRNSIILSDAVIKTGSHLDYVIADKGVVVKQHTVLTGTEEVQVVVDKGKTV